MKISTRGRYAVRILLDIALHQGDGYTAMHDIARRQQISKKYGDQIALQLTQAGMLIAARGRQGGYRLVPGAEETSMLRIIESVEGSVAPIQCLETKPNRCGRREFCPTLPVWEGLDRVVRAYLQSVTLTHLLENAPPQPEFPEGDDSCPADRPAGNTL